MKLLSAVINSCHAHHALCSFMEFPIFLTTGMPNNMAYHIPVALIYKYTITWNK